MDIAHQIKELMMKATQDSSMTSAALKQFTDLQDSCNALIAKNDELSAQLRETQQLYVKTRDGLEKANQQISSLLVEQDSARKAIVESERLKFENTFEKKRGDEHYGLLNAIFRNINTNRTITENIPVVGQPSSQYASGTSGYLAQGTRTESESAS